MSKPDAFKKYREQARRAHGCATPYRLGYFMAKDSVDLPNPYRAGSRGYSSFESGVEWARIESTLRTGESS